MARALECPACGAKHLVENLADAPTFRCDRCGQVLKMPAPVTTGGPPPPPRAAATAPASAAPAAAAPPPRRRAPDAVSAAPVAAGVVGVSATLGAVGAVEPVDRSTNQSANQSTRRGRRTPPPAQRRTKPAWYWRLVAWVVAVPLGFVITAWPAYRLGLIRKNDVLDIFVGTGTGRYVRLAIGTALWALVTALLVQLFIEGGRALRERRRARAAA